MQSWLAFLKFVNLFLIHVRVYLIQLFVIQFISVIEQVSDIFYILWFHTPVKHHNITEILLKFH